MDRLLVATLNIRNLADRWDERLPLLLADMAALGPDSSDHVGVAAHVVVG